MDAFPIARLRYAKSVRSVMDDASTPSQATSASAKNTTDAEIQAAIREAVRDYPGTALNRTADRLGMVSWSDWFPAPHETTADFLELTASFLARGPGTIPRTDQYLLSHVDTTGVATFADPSVPDRMTGPVFARSVAGRKRRHLIRLGSAS